MGCAPLHLTRKNKTEFKGSWMSVRSQVSGVGDGKATPARFQDLWQESMSARSPGSEDNPLGVHIKAASFLNDTPLRRLYKVPLMQRETRGSRETDG
jgi:hypothetical protein